MIRRNGKISHWIGRIDMFKMTILKAINTIQYLSNAHDIFFFFTKLGQIILEFIQSHEKLWIDKAILREKKRRKQKLSSAETSVQFSRSVVSHSLRPHESQHARPPCLSPTPGVYSNSCPSSWWYHPAISSSVIPFSSWPQSLPASGSFPMSQLFTWGGQSIGVSA